MSKRIIFESHPAGFFSNFNKIITTLLLNEDNVQEIIWQMSGPGMQQYRCGEVFSKLFLPFNNKETVATETLHIQLYPDTTYTAHHVIDVYKNPCQEWRKKLNRIYTKYIKFTNFLDNAWQNVFAHQFDIYNSVPKVGILISNKALEAQQPKKIMPDRTAYIGCINALNLKNYAVVCAIDNRQDLNFFNSNYKCVYNEHISRTNTVDEPESHLHNSQLTCIDAAFHFLEAFALSKCDYIIHPVSNIATAAMYMNPTAKNIFINEF